MATEQGFSNQKKKGSAQFKTIHSAGSDSFGTVSIPKYLCDISLIDKAILSISDVLGKDGLVQFWDIEITGHSASVGNILRIVDGSLKNFEFEIHSIVDANHILVLPIPPSKPLLTDLARIMGWVTGKSDEDGNLVISQGPVKFKLDNINTEVSKDSAVPANTIALPVEDFAARASLSSIDGKFTTLNAKDFATSAKQDTGNSSLSSIDGKFTTLNAKDFSTSAKQDTGNTSLSGINTNTINIPNVITAEGGSQPTHGVVVMGHTGAGIARHILVESTGRQVTHVTASALPTGAATSELQTTGNTELNDLNASFGDPITSTASTDTGTFAFMAFVKRGLQHLASIISNTTGINTKIPSNLTVTSTRLLVDGSGVTQPVSGSVSVSSLPSIPAGSNAIGSVSVSNFPATQAVQQTALTPSFQEILNLNTTAQTFTAPANAKWCKIYADDTNTVNIRIKIGGTATISSGLQLQPGRSEDFKAVGNISVIAESGSSQKVNVHFGV